MARNKKFMFDDNIKEEQPKSEEIVAEYPSVFETPVETPKIDEVLKEHEPIPKAEEIKDPEFTPVETPVEEVEDSRPEPKPEESPVEKPAAEYVPDDGADLISELKAILIPNKDYDMIRTQVHFIGMQSNYLLLEVQLERVDKAWALYKEKEGKQPGKFVELVCDILTTPTRRYYHRISTKELD